jgi:hypothetical protein
MSPLGPIFAQRAARSGACTWFPALSWVLQARMPKAEMRAGLAYVTNY